MGPVISMEARDKMIGAIEETINDGEELVYGGKIPESNPEGAFIEPTILKNIHENMSIFKNEVFGPVVSIIEFDDETDVLRQANKTDAGLASYIYTKDADRIHRFSEVLDFGEVIINGFNWSIYLPHIGIKESGVGADCSAMALDTYLVQKRITQKFAGV